MELTRVAMFLPHEIVNAIAKNSNLTLLGSTEGMADQTKTNFERAVQKLGLTNPIGCGMWLDGRPCNWDRTQSLEVLSLNFPGCTDQFGLVRIPLAAINKQFTVKHETLDDILKVVAWSFTQLALGTYPSRNHAGVSLALKDGWRFKQQKPGTALHWSAQRNSRRLGML